MCSLSVLLPAMAFANVKLFVSVHGYTSRGYYLRAAFVSLRASNCVATIWGWFLNMVTNAIHIILDIIWPIFTTLIWWHLFKEMWWLMKFIPILNILSLLSSFTTLTCTSLVFMCRLSNITLLITVWKDNEIHIFITLSYNATHTVTLESMTTYLGYI